MQVLILITIIDYAIAIVVKKVSAKLLRSGIDRSIQVIAIGPAAGTVENPVAIGIVT